MASEEHKNLAQFLKEVHSSLRHLSSLKGAEVAWSDHCKQKEILVKYAQSMEKLATKYWDVNSSKEDSAATSRIKWTAEECYNYFFNKTYLSSRAKEAVIANKIDIKLDEESFHEPIKLLDVGSCYNPFRIFNFMEVFAIDLCPANDTVLKCDFLNITIGCETKVVNSKVIELKENSFEAVTFCFLLEYLPSSELRVLACKNAYSLLKPGGLLTINTPDSKHVGANCRIMKCWRYSLALIGFTRIKYEKFKHMHCMVFRKALHKDIAVRWATLHKEPYMDGTINIPQDFQKEVIEKTSNSSVEPYNIESSEDFLEMPFYNTTY